MTAQDQLFRPFIDAWKIADTSQNQTLGAREFGYKMDKYIPLKGLADIFRLTGKG